MGREFQLIQRYLSLYGAGPQVTLGVGDDAAVVNLPPNTELVVSTDTLVEGTHFPELTLPEHIATRAIGTAASDLAAMAAEPLAMTIALTLPSADELWLHSFSQGLASAVQQFSLPLVGGDLTRGPVSVTVTVNGTVPAGRALGRGGARPGDRLCVTHTLGDAAAGLALVSGLWDPDHTLTSDQEQFLEDRFYQPTPRLDWAGWLRDNATAAIDISDGLLADVGHLARASGLGCRLDSSCLPFSAPLATVNRQQRLDWALAGGDDYELAVAVPVGVELPAHLTPVGEFVTGDGVECDYMPGGQSGYDHFGA